MSIGVPETAMVFAAGLGTRMRPLTDDRPKALIEVGGRTLIDHMLDRLSAAGVRRFVVNVYYFADRLEAHLKTRRDLDIVISDEREKLLETGGGLKKARAVLGEDPIFVVNTDSVWIEDVETHDQAATAVAELAAAFDPARMDAVLMLADLDRSLGFDAPGDFFLEDDNRLTFRGEAARAPYAYMGVHITTLSIIDGVEDDAFSLSKIWRESAKAGRLYGSRMRGDWMHVGDPAARDEAERRLQSQVTGA